MLAPLDNQVIFKIAFTDKAKAEQRLYTLAKKLKESETQILGGDYAIY